MLVLVVPDPEDESRSSPDVLNYSAPRDQKLQSEPIKLGTAPLMPLEIFPPYCCRCLAETTNLWRVLEQVRVPLCPRCARRTSILRIALAALPSAILLLIVLMIVSSEGWKRESGNKWLIIGTGAFGGMIVSAWFMVALFAWFFSPAKVIGYRHVRGVFVTFRNPDYHRLAKQWMAQGVGGREAAKRGGFPVPPKRLKE